MKPLKEVFKSVTSTVFSNHQKNDKANEETFERMICRRVRPYTMVPDERLISLIDCVDYIVSANIPGAIVECGVWRGGCIMAAALTLLKHNIRDRDFFLFDTFTGMSPPTEKDVNFKNISAAHLLAEERNEESRIWAYCDLDTVQANLKTTGYPENKFRYSKGMVENTLPNEAPAKIALLRLDTDWYESTYHELIHLFPRLQVGGVLIVDDYGHWQGCKKAVDQYIQEKQLRILLNRIDYSGRVAVKVE